MRLKHLILSALNLDFAYYGLTEQARINRVHTSSIVVLILSVGLVWAIIRFEVMRSETRDEILREDIIGNTKQDSLDQAMMRKMMQLVMLELENLKAFDRKAQSEFKKLEFERKERAQRRIQADAKNEMWKWMTMPYLLKKKQPYSAADSLQFDLMFQKAMEAHIKTLQEGK